VVGCVADENGVRVALAEVWQGADAVLKASAYTRELIAAGRQIQQVVYDPMRFDSEAQRLQRDHGLALVEWPQSETRTTCELVWVSRRPNYEDSNLGEGSSVSWQDDRSIRRS
jgi:hypothetical protein